MTYRELGRGAESLEAARKTVANAERHLELHPDDARALYLGATALQQIGETGRAMDWAERALAAEGDEPAVLYSVACFHSLAGNKERALDLLERAVDSGFGYRAWMEKDQDLIPLHGEPRFREILERLG
jgi:adenylate cyclase